MVTRYRIGYYYERKVVLFFRKAGYDAWRTPRSGTAVDVVAIRNDNNIPRVKLIQIKATSKSNFSFNSLPKEEREKLIELARKYIDNPYVDIELWIFNRKTRSKKIINIKEVYKNLFSQ